MNVGESIVNIGLSMCVVQMKARVRENKQEHSWNTAEKGLTVIDGEQDHNAHFISLHMCQNTEDQV